MRQAGHPSQPALSLWGSACDLRWQEQLGIGQGFLERLRTAGRDRQALVFVKRKHYQAGQRCELSHWHRSLELVRVQREPLELGALAEARRHPARQLVVRQAERLQLAALAELVGDGPL